MTRSAVRSRSSFLPYADFVKSGPLTWTIEAFRQWIGSTDAPAAFAMFPKDISHPPREGAERFFNVQRWTEMPRGGQDCRRETAGHTGAAETSAHASFSGSVAARAN
jgi:hypothetical protein